MTVADTIDKHVFRPIVDFGRIYLVANVFCGNFAAFDNAIMGTIAGNEAVHDLITHC